jgi:hypothetical protein
MSNPGKKWLYKFMQNTDNFSRAVSTSSRPQDVSLDFLVEEDVSWDFVYASATAESTIFSKVLRKDLGPIE